MNDVGGGPGMWAASSRKQDPGAAADGNEVWRVARHEGRHAAAAYMTGLAATDARVYTDHNDKPAGYIVCGPPAPNGIGAVITDMIVTLAPNVADRLERQADNDFVTGYVPPGRTDLIECELPRLAAGESERLAKLPPDLQAAYNRALEACGGDHHQAALLTEFAERRTEAFVQDPHFQTVADWVAVALVQEGGTLTGSQLLHVCQRGSYQHQLDHNREGG
jgi:hypothetical protein